jgi:hypothetical protein
VSEPVAQLEFPGFPAGLDTTTPLGFLGPGGARECLGLEPTPEGGLRHAGNFRQVVPATYHVLAFHRWAYGTEKRLLFVRTAADASTLLYVWNELDGTYRTLTIGHATRTIARFVQAGLTGEVYLLVGTEGNTRLLKIKDPLTDTTAIDISTYVTGTTDTFYLNQIISGSDGGAGNLNSTGYSRYQWAVQLEDADGRLSQLSMLSPPVELVNKKARLDISSSYTGYITAGDIVAATVFRTGGKATETRFVGRFLLGVVAGEVVDGTTGLPIVDDTPDESLSFTVASTYNDPAPIGLGDIILHQNKLFGYKGTGVWFSRTNQFDYWGYDENGVDDDGGVLYPDNDTGNPFNGLTSEGSLLILGRERSVYALYGSSLSAGGAQGFAFDQRSNLGNLSRLSICRSDNEALYVGRDSLLRSLRDASTPSVSGRIEKTLRHIPSAQMLTTVICHHNEQVYVSIPDAGRCYVYHASRGLWREATHAPLLARFLHAFPHPQTGQLELLSAPATGGVFACETYNDGTEGTERDVRIRTDDLRFPPEMVGRLSSILVEGDVPVGTMLVATLRAGEVSKELPLTPGSGRLLYYAALTPDLVGDFVSLEIEGAMTAGEIRRIVIGTQELRRVN